MANTVAQLLPQQTGLSPQQRQRKAAQVLATNTTSTSDAAKAAKRLCGQWPHLKADDPAIYLAGIAAVLSGYPPEIVAECCDPRIGLARSREFPPTAAAVADWCGRREAYYRKWAVFVQPRPLTPVWHEDATSLPEAVKNARAGFLTRLQGILRLGKS
jgi:hypothetical protein